MLRLIICWFRLYASNLHGCDADPNVQCIHSKCTQTGSVQTHPCTVYVCTAVISSFLATVVGSPWWSVWKWNMWNENEDVFLGPQSLFIWKRNCSSAQWNVSSSAGLPFNCTYYNFGAVLFCSSVLLFLFLFSKLEELEVSQSVILNTCQWQTDNSIQCPIL